MSKGSTSAEFWYGPDRARVLQVATRSTESERTVYLGSLYERTVITPSTGSVTTRHVHYVRAGDETVAIKTWSKVGTGTYAPQVRYPHRDHLGSVVAITTETGTVESRSSFDVWGKRRDPNTWVTPAPGTFTAAPTATDRGYTGHEHVDELGLVHMNGRIYDPEIGKFLSADPTLQFPESTQGYNRYAYAGNNPLTFTDPSGFSFWKKLMRWVGIAMSIFIPTGINLLWEKLLWGFTSGFLGAGGNLKAGLLGALGAGLFHGTHLLQSKMGLFAHSLLKGLVGGALSALAGGKFGAGFLGAFAGGILGETIGIGGESGTGTRADMLVRVMRDAIIGGVASVLGGGKFKNGAITAAFARLYNEETIDERRAAERKRLQRLELSDEESANVINFFYRNSASSISAEDVSRTGEPARKLAREMLVAALDADGLIDVLEIHVPTPFTSVGTVSTIWKGIKSWWQSLSPFVSPPDSLQSILGQISGASANTVAVYYRSKKDDVLAQ